MNRVLTHFSNVVIIIVGYMWEDQATKKRYFESFLSMQQYLHPLMLWTYATGGHEWQAQHHRNCRRVN
jgi:hypothetical protein